MSYLILCSRSQEYFNYLNIEYTEVDGIRYNDSYADFTSLLCFAEVFEDRNLAIEMIKDICYYTDCYNEEDFEVIAI